MIAASETPGTSTGIAVCCRSVDRRLPTLERPLARTKAVAPPSRVRYNAGSIKLLAGAGRAIKQMCPPRKIDRSRGRGTATVPAGRCICCKGIGLLASVPLSMLCRGPCPQKFHSRRFSLRNPIECFCWASGSVAPSSRLFLLSPWSKLVCTPRSTRRCGQVGLAPAKG